MITIRQLKKKYKCGREKIPILKGIDFQIQRGEFIAILGASGCGKSTLLNVIGGLDQFEEGDILYYNQSTKSFSNKDWDEWRKKHIGFVFQSFNLIPQLTALENVEMAMKFARVNAEERRSRAEELLKKVGLKDRMYHKPNQMSGGQKQRVAIARALANRPDVILADEPTGAVDSKTSEEIMELLQQLNREQGITIIMVTHDEELAHRTDRIITMQDGKLISDERITRREKDSSQNEKNTPDKKVRNMSFYHAVLTGVQNSLQEKKRMLLTALGMAIGVAGVLLLLGISIGAEKGVYQELNSFAGDKTIWVTGGEETVYFDRERIEELERIEGVENVLDGYGFTAIMAVDNKTAEDAIDVLGPRNIVTEYEKNLPLMGSLPKSDDAKEILITVSTAEKLSENGMDVSKLLGKNVTAVLTLNRDTEITYAVEEEFVITGIIANGIIPGPSYIPYETAKRLAQEALHVDSESEEIQPIQVEIRANEEADYQKVLSAVEKLSYGVDSNKQGFEKIAMLINAVRIFLLLVAGISLLVSGIMISIVLYMSVMERTQEIGVMRAIGGRKKDIKRIFLSEAAVIGFLSGLFGGIISIIFGVILNQIVSSRFDNIHFQLYQMNFPLIFLCIIFCMIISTMAGRKPAKKAAKVNPIEALRFE